MQILSKFCHNKHLTRYIRSTRLPQTDNLEKNHMLNSCKQFISYNVCNKQCYTTQSRKVCAGGKQQHTLSLPSLTDWWLIFTVDQYTPGDQISTYPSPYPVNTSY